MKKRFTSLIVAFVLLFSGLFFDVQTRGSVIAGAGSGVSAKVETVGEVVDILKYLMSRSDNSSDTASAILPLSATLNEEAEEEDIIKRESATITFLDHQSSYSSLSYASGNYESATVKFDRELTLYITKDKTYYNSNGLYIKNTSSNGKNHSEYLKFDMEIYLDNGHTFVKYDEFISITDGYSVQIKPENMGKWIEVPAEAMLDIIDIDSQNRDSLSYIADLLDNFIKAGIVKRGDDGVAIDSDDFKRFDSDNLSDKLFVGGEIDFKVDLSSPRNTYIEASSHLNQEDSDDYETLRNNATVEKTIKLENIDNTVIKFNKNAVSKVVKTPEDLMDLFIIKEGDTK